MGLQPSASKLAAAALGLAAAWLGALLVLRLTSRGPCVTFFVPGDIDGRIPEGTMPAGAESPVVREGLPGPLDVSQPLFPPSLFRRRPLSLTEVANLWRGDSDLLQYDRSCYFRYAGGLDRRMPWPEHPDGEWRLITNSLGLREDREVAAEQPDLRVLVAGDSHTDGVCNNAESFANRLEALLAAARPEHSVEVLNAGLGGYGFYHYLGVLERLLDLDPDVLVVAIYGGNDFEEGLTLYHAFQGTRRPEVPAACKEQVRLATARHPGPLSQVFHSLKYLALFPQEAEVALQMARDVATEIQVTCLRNGIHPIFVYLPPATDVQWDLDADRLDDLSEQLGIAPEDRTVHERLADALLAALVQQRADVVDLRAEFRAAGVPLYWHQDLHINLEAQRRIAAALLPRVEAARPAALRRVRHPPGTPEALTALLSPGASTQNRAPALPRRRPAEVRPGDPLRALPDSTLARVHVGPADVAELLRQRPELVYDGYTQFAWAPDLNLWRPNPHHPWQGWRLATDGNGLRLATRPETVEPELRLIALGDADLDGECATLRAWPALLEKALRADGSAVVVMQASAGGFALENVLGAIEKLAVLEPDLVHDTDDAGTAFEAALARREALARGDRALHPPRVARARGWEQAAALRADPERAERALDAALEILLEIRRVSAANGCDVVFIVLPHALELHGEEWGEEEFAASGITPEDLQVARRLRRSLVASLEQAGATCLDAEQAFCPDEGPYYWPLGFTLSLEGQRRLAREVEDLLRRRPIETR